jgi:hypothetical protein
MNDSCVEVSASRVSQCRIRGRRVWASVSGTQHVRPSVEKEHPTCANDRKNQDFTGGAPFLPSRCQRVMSMVCCEMLSRIQTLFTQFERMGLPDEDDSLSGRRNSYG